MLVERVRNYQASGAAALGVYSDKEEPVNAHEAFVALKREQAGSARHCAHLYTHLESYPQNPPPDSESFVYWAKQKFGDLKPVINVVQVLIHREGNCVYIASKHVIEGLTKSVALEFAKPNIRIKAVAPGPIATDMWDRFAGEELAAQVTSPVPAGRVGGADKIAAAVLYLASDAAKFTTSASLVVDGGFIAG